MEDNVTRRDFLKITPIAVAVIFMMSIAPWSSALEVTKEGGMIVIVMARDTKCFVGGVVDTVRVQNMVNNSIIELTGIVNDMPLAYQCIFPQVTADTKIVIKYNPNAPTTTIMPMINALKKGFCSMLNNTFPPANVTLVGAHRGARATDTIVVDSSGQNLKYTIKDVYSNADYIIYCPSAVADTVIGCGTDMCMSLMLTSIEGVGGATVEDLYPLVLDTGLHSLSTLNFHPCFNGDSVKTCLYMLDLLSYIGPTGTVGEGNRIYTTQNISVCDWKGMRFLSDSVGVLDSAHTYQAQKVCTLSCAPYCDLGVVNEGQMFEIHVECSTITGAITITSPNGGEQWEMGKCYNVSWTHDITGNIKIDLYTGGVINSTIAASIANTSPYSWTIPNMLTPGTDYTIKITSIDFPTTSDVSNAEFTILPAGVAPTVTSTFPYNAVIPEGSDYSLAGAATGTPAPTYVWYYMKTLASSPDSTDNDSILSITNAAKSDSGYFYFVATNASDSASSDTICLQVIKPVSITTDLQTTYTVVQGGAATFNLEVSGDGIISYQWYEDGSFLPGETGKSYTIPKVDSVTHHGKAYHCEVWNTFLGKVIDTVLSKSSKIVVSSYYNPFTVKAERIDPHNTTQVKLSLCSDVDISNFPYTQSSTDPWADSVWVMYKSNDYASNYNDAIVLHYSTAEIKNAAPNPVVHTINVPPMQTPHDSSYWFNYSVLWHIPGGSDLLLTPYAEANKLFMFDTEVPENNLTVTGLYIDGKDSAQLTISNTLSLNATWDSIVTFVGSDFAVMTPTLWDVKLTVAALQAGGDTYSMKVKVGDAPFESKKIYCHWFVTGKNTMESTKKPMQFLAGQSHPEYTGSLAAYTNIPDQVFLVWDPPDAGTDTVRIWWNTAAIPLAYNITLPENQAVYVSPSQTKDTVVNLNPETMYYCGLQIKKDNMWSYVTMESSDSVKTPKADSSLMVTNKISVSSAWFDTISNSMCISWTIDTTGLTSDSTILQWGCSYSIDSESYKTAQPSWTDFTKTTETIAIALGQDILFNTTYYFGMWLRKKKLEGGAGVAAGPVSASSSTVTTPETFTWQQITLSKSKLDTAYAMNGKIIIQSITQFDFTDTLKAYKLQEPLPTGLVKVGGAFFTFSSNTQQVPPFKLGMDFDDLRSGITEDDIGLYQVVNGMIQVFYGFEVKDGIVWATITSPDMAYPFLVLADTSAPVISFTGMCDTSSHLCLGDVETVKFSIGDNIANVEWHFMYGKGNEEYKFKFDGYSDAYLDTVSEVMYTSSGCDDYGIRAVIALSDGVHNDTINISRRIATANSDSMVAPAKTWVPLRATASLTDSTLPAVLSTFNNTQGVWEYDKTKFRALRWYDITGTGDCEIVEYSDAVKEDFCFIPGRVIWLKTAEWQTVTFGPGVSSSLREPFTIELQSKTWTDFSLPYKFPIKLKDIVNATGGTANSLVFYHWVKSGATYTALSTYIPALDSISGKLDTITLIHEPSEDAYTVYNNSDQKVVLYIPPTPPVLSTSRPVSRTGEGQEIWDVHLVWKSSNNSLMNRIRCGCDNTGTGKPLIGPLPPSFNSVGAGVTDVSGTVGSYGVYHSIDKGGLSYEIIFYNQSKQAEKIEYYLDNLKVLPEGLTARIYDPYTANYESISEGTAALSLEPGESERRWIVLGNENYFNQFLKKSIVSNFAILGMYPNPFRGRINIHYVVPWQGVRKIEFHVYDLHGRTVWEKVLSHGVQPGVNSITWKTSSENGYHVASGVYLFRMKVYENGKKKPKVFKRKLTCLR